MVSPGAENARPLLGSLPAPGDLLVTNRSGAWIVRADGSKRRLGSYRQAAWSAYGRYAAVTTRHALTAVALDGTVRWSLSRRGPVSDPVWSPSGLRVAYRDGAALRVVAGDGTGDRLLRRRVAPVAPAWQPLSPGELRCSNPTSGIAPCARNVLAYAGGDGAVHVVDADTGRELWRSAAFGARVVGLDWSRQRRLLVLTPGFFVVYDARGRTVYKGPAAVRGGVGEAAAFSPGGHRIALASRRLGSSDLLLARPGTAAPLRRLYHASGRFSRIAWSPDGRQILVAWPSANQWIFVNPASGKASAVADVSHEFAPGAPGAAGFPEPAGWCCSGP